MKCTLVKKKKKKSPKEAVFSLMTYSYTVPCNWGSLPDLELGWKGWGEMRQPWKLPLRGAWGSWVVFPQSFLPLHQFSSVQFSHSVMSNSLRPHGQQHARPPCPSLTPGLPKLMSIESGMPSNHLVLCRPLLLLSPNPPSIRVFSND